MMKLFVAGYGYDFEGYYVVGVFSSREKAEEHLEKHYKSMGDFKKIEEMILDEGELINV